MSLWLGICRRVWGELVDGHSRLDGEVLKG